MPSEAQGRVAELWKQYKRTGSQDVRNELIEHYLPLVRNHAERLKAKLPGVVQVDDLSTAGVLGLMDELRGLDWVPRLVRQRAKMLSEASATLRSALGRQPSEQEVAEHMNVPLDEFKRIAGDGRPANVFSIYGKRPNNQGGDVEDPEDVANLCDERSANPLLLAQHKTLKDVLTRGFTRSERLIVVLYYYEQLTMKEIGATLDLSESRVSQMHTSIVNRLRVTLSERAVEFEGAQKVA